MVLSDRTIERLIGEGRIAIDPYDASLLQPSSLDVRVDRYFRVFHNARYPFIDVKQPQEELTEEVEIAGDQPFILHPGEFVLGSTLERVTLPDDLVARLEGKSSLGRLGLLIHSTAGFIDPGWDGHVTLELSNVANLPITIYYGMKIGQVSFMQLSEPASIALRQRDARIEVPGPARADAQPLLAELRVMKILVAGGTGFVGTAIVHALRARGLEVRVLARHPERIASLESLGVELVRGDLTDADSLAPAVEGCSHVVNLVAIIKGAPDDFERVMTRGTAALIAAAREGGVERFVQMSALGTNEQTSTMVPYYGAKWAIEREVRGAPGSSTCSSARASSSAEAARCRRSSNR